MEERSQERRVLDSFSLLVSLLVSRLVFPLPRSRKPRKNSNDSFTSCFFVVDSMFSFSFLIIFCGSGWRALDPRNVFFVCFSCVLCVFSSCFGGVLSVAFVVVVFLHLYTNSIFFCLVPLLFSFLSYLLFVRFLSIPYLFFLLISYFVFSYFLFSYFLFSSFSVFVFFLSFFSSLSSCFLVVDWPFVFSSASCFFFSLFLSFLFSSYSLLSFLFPVVSVCSSFLFFTRPFFV